MEGCRGRGARLAALHNALGLLLGPTGLCAAKMTLKKPKAPAEAWQAACQLNKSN